MKTAITTYLNQLALNIQTGSAKEHTHRAALEILIETIAPNVNAVNEPKRIACGAPDYVVLNKKNNLPLGYIEAKDIGISLDKVQKTEQLKRYLDSLNNLILTDYLEFRWFVEGEYKPEMTLRLAKLNKNNELIPIPKSLSAFGNLIDTFINTSVITLKSPDDLAQRMAKIASLIRDVILKAYNQEPDKSGTLHAQLESFRQVLLDDLTIEQFADMYAQTICYGLFAARCHLPVGETFSRIQAAHHLPKTNPFLRHLFNQIAGIDLDERLVWAVEHLVEVLNKADIAAILADFGKKKTRQEDPVVHFYEIFLAHYDSKMREKRGVYYTPEPVVSYIIRSVDLLLKQVFKFKKGLAESGKINTPAGEIHQVQILDPAVGTGTFLYTLIEHIYQKIGRNKGLWSNYVKEHLLPRVHGFELLMAPYTVAHMKLGLQLQEKGYDFQSDERLRLFLTNTLDEAHTVQQQTMMAQWLSQEANAAKAVKTDMPVMVIIGNPPYSGHSANTGTWIKTLLRGGEDGNLANYFAVDGKKLDERNPKWLNDDYVKFMRFAHWRIMETGYGILGFVTNHGYLDNPTFRGMRQSLLEDFDEIYILDLHGNSKKKEKAPDGSADKNVFDIQQGVAIGIFVKHKQKQSQNAKIYHAELWGEREGKYEYLAEQDVIKTNWTELKPQSPFYLFIPQNVELLGEYEQGWKITDIMPVNVLGFQTHRDHFAVAFDKNTIKKRIIEMRDLETTNSVFSEKYNLRDNRDWKITQARQIVQQHNEWEKNIVRCLYRPFDWRYCYFSEVAMDYPRRDLKNHVANKDNLCLGLGRQGIAVTEPIWSLITMSHEPIDANIFRRGGVNVFPLYLYPTKKTDLFAPENTDNKRRPNLSPEFIVDLENRLSLTFIPEGSGYFKKTISTEDIFYYIYAIFHSPSYRQRYAEFLKIDFPRLPLTSNKALFQKLVKLGAKLVKIHLMEADDIESNSGFPIEGDNQVDKLSYKNERIYINQTQYFDNIKPELWEFKIGGYQVCHKWLKDRKGRILNYEDCEHYLYILAALENTMVLMTEIDEVLSGFPLK